MMKRCSDKERRKTNKTNDKTIDKDMKIHARLEEKDRRDWNEGIGTQREELKGDFRPSLKGFHFSSRQSFIANYSGLF